MPFTFLKEIFRDYKVGAVTKSSSFVVKKVLSEIGPSDKLIVEYGPGDGVVIKPLLKILSKDAKIVGIEPNQNFFQKLKKIGDKRFEAINGYAGKTENKIHRADIVISSIPFTLMSKKEREEIIKFTHQALRPGGKFIVYQYSTLVLSILKKYFKTVDVSLEPRNLPPYFFMVCRK
ncbi:MAG: methyltransferase domain-containing protein [Candidatus Vogelbacteria bacterium]|nr:methyltransferase domain-containing protein [Candidatus Vogelbacteria bacterium]